MISFLTLQTPDFYVEMKWEFTSWGKKLNNMFSFFNVAEDTCSI